jgi:plastocyanin
MEMTYSNTAVPGAARVSALGRLNAAALIGVAISLAVLSAAFFGFDLVSLVIVGLCVASAGLIFTGWRWAPLPGLIPGLVVPALFGSMLLADPASPPFFPGLLLVGCGALVGIAAIAGTIQNYRRPAGDRPLPRWVARAGVLLAGLLAGAALTALAPRPAASAGIGPEVLASLPSLTGQNFTFSQGAIHARVGETVALRLENADPATHWFEIDELNVHAPMPVGQTGVALFKPTQPGTYTFYCTPHYDKATGQGMHGTLIVEP